MSGRSGTPPTMISTNEVFDVAEQRKRRATLAARREMRKQAAQCTAMSILAQRITPETMNSEPDVVLSALCDLQSLAREQFASLSWTAHAHWQSAAATYFGTDRKFSIAYVDPPWQYNARANATSTSPHYDVMSDADLLRMPLRGLMKDDAAVALWATSPKFDVAVRVLEAWGFEFRTVMITWIKVTAAGQTPVYSSTCAYSRPNAEYLLIGVRGSMQVAKRASYMIDSVLETRRTEHSHKPNCVRDMLVSVFGDRTRIELFARETVPGWTTWGNETTKFNQQYANGGDDDFDNSSRRSLVRPGRTRVNNLSAVPTRVNKERRLQLNHNDRASESATAYYNKPCPGTKMTKSDFIVLGSDSQEHRQFNHVLDLRSFFDDTDVSLRDRRHTTYTSLTVREAAQHEPMIRRAQEHYDEMLFAMNNNKGASRRMVRYSDPEMAEQFDGATESIVAERSKATPQRKDGRKRKLVEPSEIDDVDDVDADQQPTVDGPVYSKRSMRH